MADTGFIHFHISLGLFRLCQRKQIIHVLLMDHIFASGKLQKLLKNKHCSVYPFLTAGDLKLTISFHGLHL